MEITNNSIFIPVDPVNRQTVDSILDCNRDSLCSTRYYAVLRQYGRDLFRREAKTSYPVSDWETRRSNHWNNQGSHFVRRFDRCHRHSRCRQRVTCKV